MTNGKNIIKKISNIFFSLADKIQGCLKEGKKEKIEVIRIHFLV
jgi:hypothetical protein